MTGHKHRWLPPAPGTMTSLYRCLDCGVVVETSEYEDEAAKLAKVREAERRAGKPIGSLR